MTEQDRVVFEGTPEEIEMVKNLVRDGLGMEAVRPLIEPESVLPSENSPHLNLLKFSDGTTQECLARSKAENLLRTKLEEPRSYIYTTFVVFRYSAAEEVLGRTHNWGRDMFMNYGRLQAWERATRHGEEANVPNPFKPEQARQLRALVELIDSTLETED